MSIVGIPGVRIVEAVHVRLELALVDVHVGDEIELYSIPSESLPFAVQDG